MIKYSLHIARTDTYITFDNFEEFKRAVASYFTPSESAIVERLTTFKMHTIRADNGYTYKQGISTWRDFTTDCCIFEY